MNLRQEDFTEQALESLKISQEMAIENLHSEWDAEHLFVGLLEVKDSIAEKILDFLNADVDEIKEELKNRLNSYPKVGSSPSNTGQLFATERVFSVIEVAREEANRLKDDLIGADHLLVALTVEDSGDITELLKKFGIDQESVYQALLEVRGSARVSDPQAESKYKVLSKYSVDLTQLARSGKLDPVIGRDLEIKRVMQTITRRTKNNPVLTGDAGVGKTAIAEGLAQRIVSGDVPESLKDRRVLSLEMGTLLAGAKFRGEFEDRLKAVMDEIRQASGEIVLFIDEIHKVVGAGSADGAIDASNMMKPALARGELQTIGATTLDEYRKYIESDAALERRFSPILVEEPKPAIARSMLEILRPRYEQHHGLKIEDDALGAAIELSSRYVSDRFLPDKAIDLIDEASAKLRIENDAMPKEIKDLDKSIRNLKDKEESAFSRTEYENAANFKSERLRNEEDYQKRKHEWQKEHEVSETVRDHDIAALIEERTGVPVTRLLEGDVERLLNLETNLHTRVIGQDRAVEALADSVRRARAGLKDPNRPIGSFIFLGPTGVGKTELARSLAEFMFDDENNMIRIDMSEYQESHNVSRLIGAPPGYVGYDDAGQLTEQVRRRPFSVVLFDEIEKAHPEIFNTLLQVLDDGRLTDGHGRTVNFRNTIIIMTSNLGSDVISKESFGFKKNADDQAEEKKILIEDELKKSFKPEFINRIDEFIIFDSLTLEDVKKIVDKFLEEISNRLKSDMGLEIKISDEAKEWLASTGFDSTYGARPLRRAIQKHIENPLAREFIKNQYVHGDKVAIDVSDSSIVFK
ncbi:MAG: AAA family ATPase [Dehalococcoidia bacterium]|jgi:ATP-dependent Clp protease ATP-binding subunit ClpC|nr:Clp protease [Chloroflexota bacterium]MDP7232432.1 AAA family ATPase [Dehalococcoidia bacterium]MDP7613480.1 AAA family ATPase [Dehalococcoidia bacterium]|tara:strand:- start:1500 stop:3923 length:2424 start_codon:yes stop_codon:yes gene_type:complete